jgi:hypothetical protein
MSLAGTVVHLHYIVMLNGSSAQTDITRHLPAKLTVHVFNEYNLLKEQSTAEQNSSSSSSYRQERGSERSDKTYWTRNPETEVLLHIVQLTMLNGRTSSTPVVIRLAKRTQDRKTPKHESIQSRLSCKSEIPGSKYLVSVSTKIYLPGA